MIDKILFLGPIGSYSDIAKTRFKNFFSSNCCYEPIDSIHKIIIELYNTAHNTIGAIIPIENSIEGIVRDTQDNLYSLATKGFRIQAETRLTIEHSLITYAKSKSDIKIIKSHPQALAQCRDYIYSNWGDNIELLPTLSTSKAVNSISSVDIEVAAIGSKHCANIYNIPILESMINDEKNNTTRFILLSKIPPSKTTQNKVSITFSTENKPGALNQVLNILEIYNINMTYIDSRPSRKELGEYVFYIDFEGFSEDSNTVLALAEIQKNVKMFELLSLGSEIID